MISERSSATTRVGTKTMKSRIKWMAYSNCNRLPSRLLTLQKPLVSLRDSLFQINARPPAQIPHPGTIQQFSGRAVWLGSIEYQLPFITHNPANQLGQFPYTDVFAGSNIDDIGRIVVQHEEDGRLGHIVHVQEFTPRLTASPNHHLRQMFQTCFMGFAD